MKSISKFVFALLMVISASSVFAFEPSYLQSSLPTTLKSKGQYTEAFIVNQTYESYMVYSTYQGTSRRFNMPLYAKGSGADAIKFPIEYPDYAVCLDVIQNYTGVRVYNGCLSSGTIYIHYGPSNKVVVEKK